MQIKAILVALASAAAVRAIAVPAQNRAAHCAAAQKLVEGIDKNIGAQKMEQEAVGEIKKILSVEGQVDEAKFAQAKQELLGHVNEGIEIREENQKMAPAGSPAIPGLATVADAQKTELQQSEGLKGNKDDLKVAEELEKEFAGGIEQNEKNKEGCHGGMLSVPHRLQKHQTRAMTGPGYDTAGWSFRLQDFVLGQNHGLGTGCRYIMCI
ncbi:hypothetical protein RB597_000881 [Gaeumannomyces tritici]